MANRALSVCKQAEEFLSLVVAAGSLRGERPSLFVTSLAKEAYEIVFLRIPAGKFSEHPAYQGPDPDFHGYSRYKFSEGGVVGLYTSTPDHAIVLELRLANRQVIAAKAEAAA